MNNSITHSELVNNEAAPLPIAPIPAYQGIFSTAEIIHLLKRTMFGIVVSDVQQLTGLSVSAAVGQLLQASITTPEPPVKTYSNAATTPSSDPDELLNIGQTWVNTFTNDGDVNSNRRNSYKAWWTGLLLQQPLSIHEKMVLFWHNHFATETKDINHGIGCYYHQLTLRKHALGNFKAMVKAITLDPAMLRYLNGEQNNKNAPDENYGRELQELFTLGKGPNSKYTEDDVKAAAKVLTGYRINYNNITSYFDATRHDTSDKQFSSFYNNTIIKGKSGSQGTLELDELLDMIFAQQEVSLHLVRKIYRFFVYYDITPSIETEVIQPLATFFQQQQYEILPVLEALLTSDHFFKSTNRGCIIKSPLDVVIGTCRTFKITLPQDVTAKYLHWAYLLTQAANQSMDLGDPPDVAGWKAWYQAPAFNEIWINSDTLPKRNQFVDTLLLTGYARNGFTLQFDVLQFAKSLPKPEDPNQLVTDSIDYLLALPLSDEIKLQIKKDILLSGQASDYYWTNAWIDYINNPNNNTAMVLVRTRLRSFYQYLLNLAEYQLM